MNDGQERPSPLGAASYTLVHALRGIRHGLLIQLASTGTMAVGLLLVGLAFLAAANLDRLTARWGRGLQVIAYLKAEAPETRVAALVKLLEGRPEVSSVKRVTSRAAYGRLRASLDGRRELLEGLEEGLLPSSLEIGLRPVPAEEQRPLLALLGASSVVEEVDHMGRFTERLGSLSTLLDTAGLCIALIAVLASLYVVSSTIRLGVHARREEIEILRLVGATRRFVSAPFMIEGALQGLSAGLLAAGVLYLVHLALAPRLEVSLRAIFSAMPIRFLSAPELAIGAGAAVLLGILGSRLALGRYLAV
jgi:cell division transport system permease protein